MAGCMKQISIVTVVNIKFIVLLLLVFCLPQKSCQATAGTKRQVINITHDQKLESPVFSHTGDNHFCYINSIVPGWKQTWTRIQVGVWSSKELKVIVAEDEEKLQELESFGFWSIVQWFMHERSNETTINVSLFSKKRCFKVEPVDGKTPYTIKPIHKFDVFLFAVFLAGVFLFVFADTLSRSQLFYYSGGVSTGMIASLLILIYIMSRFLPKKSPFYVLVVGGWSFSVYAIQLVFKNLNVILREHWNLVLGYTTVVGFISFAVCYRYGPLVDKRSINILSWTLQLCGLMLIYLGVQIQSVAFAIILAALCSKTLEYTVSLALSAWRKIKPSLGWKMKPEPRRLLTEEEYQRQGEEETRRAMEELRKYCASPEFSPWKAVSRLQSPKRFADFVEGSLHLLPNEVSQHTQEYGLGGAYFEDELFSTDEDEEEDDFKPVMNSTG